MLTLNNLTIKTPDRQILKPISLSILPGGIFNFYGPNGVGKTSLLNTIAYKFCEHGQILLNKKELSILHSTYIEINFECYHELTVIENLQLFASLNDNVLALMPSIRVFELEEILDYKFKSLSTGWKKRVLLSTLLFTKTPIWIIDEPFCNLDSVVQSRLYDVLLSRAANGGIILLSSHSPLQFEDVININLEKFAC